MTRTRSSTVRVLVDLLLYQFLFNGCSTSYMYNYTHWYYSYPGSTQVLLVASSTHIVLSVHECIALMVFEYCTIFQKIVGTSTSMQAALSASCSAGACMSHDVL